MIPPEKEKIPQFCSYCRSPLVEKQVLEDARYDIYTGEQRPRIVRYCPKRWQKPPFLKRLFGVDDSYKHSHHVRMRTGFWL